MKVNSNCLKTIFYFIFTLTLFSSNNLNKTKIEFQAKFDEAKKHYPFDNWRKSFNDGLEQYTQANYYKAKKLFDDLIVGLVNIGENASESDKVALCIYLRA